MLVWRVAENSGLDRRLRTNGVTTREYTKALERVDLGSMLCTRINRWCQPRWNLSRNGATWAAMPIMDNVSSLWGQSATVTLPRSVWPTAAVKTRNTLRSKMEVGALATTTIPQPRV
jgi:hypothetical protein